MKTERLNVWLPEDIEKLKCNRKFKLAKEIIDSRLQLPKETMMVNNDMVNGEKL